MSFFLIKFANDQTASEFPYVFCACADISGENRVWNSPFLSIRSPLVQTCFRKALTVLLSFSHYLFVSVSKGFEESTGRGALKVTDAWCQIWRTSKRISKARELKCSKDRISFKVCSKIRFVEHRYGVLRVMPFIVQRLTLFSTFLVARVKLWDILEFSRRSGQT